MPIIIPSKYALWWYACSNQGQRTAYYNELIQPIIIPFVPEKKTVICDFENDELGKAYGMTGVKSGCGRKRPGWEEW